jgi:hypothetical protein
LKWPSSASSPVSADGLTPATYIYDSDPTLYSRYTFLLYLNDSFTNGCTTFFLPDPNRDGVLDARSVKPRAGSALVFPHGAAKGSLLHEGSPVFPCEQEGAKVSPGSSVRLCASRLTCSDIESVCHSDRSLVRGRSHPQCRRGRRRWWTRLGFAFLIWISADCILDLFHMEEVSIYQSRSHRLLIASSPSSSTPPGSPSPIQARRSAGPSPPLPCRRHRTAAPIPATPPTS